MKPQYHRYSESDPVAGSTPVNHRSTGERGLHAFNARPPSAVQYRRYPSLSDDGQSWFPRLRRAPISADHSAAALNSANESGQSPLFAARAFVLLAIVAVMAAL